MPILSKWGAFDMSKLLDSWQADLIATIENSHTLGMSQITQVIYETLEEADWSRQSIELLADGLKSFAEYRSLLD